MRREGHKHGLMKGKGFIRLHDSLVVVRSWWIDACRKSNDGKTMYLTINDDYFDDISSKYIHTYDDLIDSPLTMPIYDHYMVDSSSQCHEIHGVISDYKHDPKNEKLEIEIDLENSSPLMYFNEADFNLKQMSVLNFDDDDEETAQDLEKEEDESSAALVGSVGRRRLLRRRLAKKRKFSKTISLPLDEIDKQNSPIIYKNKQLGQYNCTVTPWFDITIGFRMRYRLDLKKQKLYNIEGSLTVEAGIDALIQLEFGELSQDGSISKELFSKRFSKKKFKTSVGPVVITTKPFVDISVELVRPALKVKLGATGHISGYIKAYAGWENKEGTYGGVDDNFKYDFGVLKPVYPGSNGRLEAEFAIYVAPGLTFGLWNKDIVSVKAPIGLPKIVPYAELNDCEYGNDVYGVTFGVDMYVTGTIDLEIQKIKLFGERIFKGYSWTPDNDILSLKIWDTSYELLSCPSEPDTEDVEAITIEEINVVTLEENGELDLYSYAYTDDSLPVIFYTDFVGSGVTWYEANTLCNTHHGTQLFTIDSQTRYEQVKITTAYAGTTGLHDMDEHVWVGLNDIDSDDIWSWIENDEEFVEESTYGWDANLNYGGKCGDFYFHSTSYDFVQRSCNDTLQSFACRLPDIQDYNEKYIGVYRYDVYNTWDEANDYCNDTFGTELATILWDNDNDDAYNTIAAINNIISYPTASAWIGISNITGETDFDFSDNRDSYTTGYTNWDSANGEPLYDVVINPRIAMGRSGDGDGFDKLWHSYSADYITMNAFICNRPNFYTFHAYDEFIAVEAQFGLSWDDANLLCEEEFDTQLASIHSQTEQDLVYEITHTTLKWDETITNSNQRWIWIGGYDSNDDNTFSWQDGTTFNYDNWAGGEPASGNGDKCIVLRVDDANVWHDDECEYKMARFICNRAQSEVILGDYIGINTHDDDYVYTNEEADNYCLSHYGTHLASIHSTDQNNNTMQLFSVLDAFDGAWVGLYTDDSNSQYLWRDGSSLTYMNFPSWTGYDTAYAVHDACSIITQSFYPMWDATFCTNTYSAFMCNRAEQEIVTDLYVGVNFYNNLGGVYYTWDEGEEYCVNTYGTHLASILDETQREEAMSIADAFGYDLSLPIGLNDKNAEGTWEWIDGNTFSYEYWRTNQPDGDGDCGEIRAFENWEDNWNDIGCNTGYYKAFLCNREPIVYQDGDYVVLNFLNNRYFTYDEADTYCYDTYHESTLATNMDNDDDFNLQLDMLDKVRGEYNSYAWIGITDQTSEGTYQWADGSGTVSSSSSYFAGNQPDDWNNEDCVELISHWYGWNDRDCDSERNTFICNNPYYTYRYGGYIGIVETSGNNELHLTHVEANNYCKQTFGTNLASVYSSDAYDEIVIISDELNNKIGSILETRIGLSNPTQDYINWVWQDGSIANYTDWYTGEPDTTLNEYCGVIDDEHLHSTDCNTVSRSWICNADAPKTNNLLCYYDALWNVIKGSWSETIHTNNEYNYKYPCAISNTNSDRGNVIWIGDSVSNNYAYIEDFRFDLESFTLTVLLQIDSGVGDAGILFRATSVSSNNDYGQQYYFGIDIPDNYATIGRMNDGWQRLDSETIVPSLSYGTIYELKIVASGNGDYEFYLDDNLLFGGTKTLTDFTSGSIGLRSFKAPYTVYSVVLEQN